MLTLEYFFNAKSGFKNSIKMLTKDLVFLSFKKLYHLWKNTFPLKYMMQDKNFKALIKIMEDSSIFKNLQIIVLEKIKI